MNVVEKIQSCAVEERLGVPTVGLYWPYTCDVYSNNKNVVISGISPLHWNTYTCS